MDEEKDIEQMEPENEAPENEVPESMEDEGEKAPQSAKEKFFAYYKGKNADRDTDDEEKFWGDIYSDYESRDNDMKELEGYRAANEKIMAAMDKNPSFGSLFIEMLNDSETNPLLYFIAEYGEDFKDALEDPEMLEKVVAANQKHLEAVAKNKKLEEESMANLPKSLEALDRAKEKLGASDEEAKAVAEKFYQILNDAVVEKVDEETWLAWFKAMKYDQDLESARAEGEVKGRNAKIGKVKLKKEFAETDGMPQGPSASVAKLKPKSTIGGYLGEERKSVWDK